MNILLIPSWYPWRGSPLRGIFFKEQAVHVGRMRPGWKIAVAVWGQRRYTLSLRNPFKTLAVLGGFLRARAGRKKHFLLPNVCEYRQPILEWSKRWQQGNLEGMVRACRRVLARVERDWGRPDLIHAQVAFPAGWIAMELSRTSAIPYLVTEHMGDFPFSEFRNADGSIKEAVSEPLRGARAVIAVSPAQAARIAGKGFDRPRVIANMVDEEFFKLSDRKREPGATFVFFSLAALKAAKGIADLLQAAAIFLAGLDDPGRQRVEFRIGGGGEQAGRLKALARELKIAPWLRWLGPLSRARTPEYFHGCDCFVLPSHLESFGLALLEALACGKPVVATRCGGPEFMVTPENGILVERQNPAELAQALQEMFRHAGEYDARLIRGSILERFSRAAVTGQIEALYREVTEAGSARP